ncbi:hypothetical protein [Symbiopectobacterium purcellii]|uniref:Uncharacterized protein n=1 Tax=Symbiopectobacterium purcellii TaxID=2871826 RepID=A0ABX9AN55_9ENTR|nr:hypothetical protein [Symbiopectobacterium purcellii]QZN96625.1 hypothetical protein K6K13_04085 [Symbiopectobacterium purcellii]
MVITRNQDWRIAQKQRKKSRDVHTALSRFHGEKNGKMLYTRSDKVVRAAQLGMAYPRMTNPLRAKRGQEEYQLANECSFYMQP